MGGELLISTGHSQTLEGCFRLAIHLHHPRFDTTQGPSRHHRREAVGTTGFLFHSEVGQQGRLTISGGQKTMAKHSLLPDVRFQHMAVRGSPFSENHLQQIQFRLFLKHQQNPCGHEPFATGKHQLQRWNLAANPQGQQLVTAGVVELDRPGLGTTAAIQGVPKGLLQLR